MGLTQHSKGETNVLLARDMACGPCCENKRRKKLKRKKSFKSKSHMLTLDDCAYWKKWK